MQIALRSTGCTTAAGQISHKAALVLLYGYPRLLVLTVSTTPRSCKSACRCGMRTHCVRQPSSVSQCKPATIITPLCRITSLQRSALEHTPQTPMGTDTSTSEAQVGPIHVAQHGHSSALMTAVLARVAGTRHGPGHSAMTPTVLHGLGLPQ